MRFSLCKHGIPSILTFSSFLRSSGSSRSKQSLRDTIGSRNRPERACTHSDEDYDVTRGGMGHTRAHTLPAGRSDWLWKPQKCSARKTLDLRKMQNPNRAGSLGGAGGGGGGGGGLSRGRTEVCLPPELPGKTTLTGF